MKPNLFPALVVGLAGALSSASQAQDTHEAMKPAGGHAMAGEAMTPELKKDMADMYQKMADCLRTDKSVDQCSQDAMKNCPVMEKTGHCPINEGMGAAGKKMKHGTAGMEKGGMEKGMGMGMGMGGMKDKDNGK